MFRFPLSIVKLRYILYIYIISTVLCFPSIYTSVHPACCSLYVCFTIVKSKGSPNELQTQLGSPLDGGCGTITGTISSSLYSGVEKSHHMPDRPGTQAFTPSPLFSCLPTLCMSLSVTLSFPCLPSLPLVFLPFPPSRLVTCIRCLHSCRLYIQSLSGQARHLSAHTLVVQCRATAVLQQTCTISEWNLLERQCFGFSLHNDSLMHPIHTNT